MAFIYVARSPAVAEWASDVGLGKHVYLVGVSEDDPADAVKAAKWCGEADWTLVKSQEADVTEEAALERLGRKEKMVDPNFYPRLRGHKGLFKVKVESVENSIVVAQALAGKDPKLGKLKPADIATYLINNAVK